MPNPHFIFHDSGSAIPYYTFSALDRFSGLRHAVLTRLGGVSPAPWDSLNLGWTVGDEKANVEANYRRWTKALGVERSRLTTTWQVHGKRVLRADESNVGSMLGKADAIITNAPRAPLVQRYADCTPILLYDPVQRAIGIAHAGWQGTVAGVAQATVRAMQEAFDTNPPDLTAAVGPAIGPCCYEVGPEVVAAISTSQAQPELLLSPGPRPGHAHLDLWRANALQLRAAGVDNVEIAGLCTACHRHIFFSHRGDHGRSGRFAAFIMLEPDA